MKGGVVFDLSGEACDSDILGASERPFIHEMVAGV